MTTTMSGESTVEFDDAERAARHRRGTLTTFAEVLGYARYLCDQLELRDWVVHLAEQPTDSDAHAACYVWQKYKGVNIKLGAEWQDWEAEDFRSLLLHELIHMYTVPITRAFDGLESLVGRLTWDALTPAVDQQMEIATEGLAWALAPRLALPQDAPRPDVPAYRYEEQGEWYWLLDYPDAVRSAACSEATA